MAAHRHLAAAQHRRRLPAADHRTVLADPATVETGLFGDLADDDGEMPEPELDLDSPGTGCTTC